MATKVVGAVMMAALLCRFSPVASQILPEPVERQGNQRHIGELVDNKSLFTLGALAVLGGASFFMGRNVGMRENMQQYGYGYQNQGYGYQQYGMQYPSTYYNLQPQYTQHKLHKGFQAGIYARPIVYRGKRQAEEENDREDLSEQEQIQKTDDQASGCHGNNDDNSEITDVPEPSFDALMDVAELINEIGRSSVSNAKQTSIKSNNRRFRRSLNKRPTLVVTSAPINVADDPQGDRNIHFLSSKFGSRDTVTRYKDEPEPRRKNRYEGLYSRLKDSGVTMGLTSRPKVQEVVAEPKYRSRISEERQNLVCDENSQARNFEYFELMMLESALAEDDRGCGMSLVCEIGRVPLPLLPPKALGLRRLLTGRKPRGLDGVVWGALTESLLGGLSGGDCTQRHITCPTPPADLLRVFSTL